MRKRFQMLVCAAAFTAAAGLCTLPLTAFAADAAVLLPDESAPVVEVVLEPLTPAAEEVPETTELAEPETDLPETPGIVTLPAEGIVVVVPVVDTAPGTDPEPSTEPTDPEEPGTPAETPEAPADPETPADPTDPAEPDAPADADADPSDTPDQPTAEPADSGIALLPAKDAETPVVVPTAAEGTVDIDVSWGAMEFTYTAAWNPSTLAYDPGSWTASGNTVTVTNNGTASATIGFSCTSTAAGVTAAFDQSGGLLAGGSSTTAALTLSGVWTPAEWGTAVSVGTATVTVGAVQSSTPVQSTPAGNPAPSETTEPTGTEESDLS